VYEVDFLPVESENGPGSKSGDAIAVHFKRATTGEDMVVVIDGGFTAVGDDLAEHIERWYGTRYVDLVISTHPDADHINGIARLLERLEVGELLLHQPMLHHPDVSDFSNIEAVQNLLDVAKEQDVTVTEPFTDLTRFEGQLMILGPTRSYYEQLVSQHIQEEQSGTTMRAASTAGRIIEFAKSLLDHTLSYLPVETLTDDGDTGPRNNSSVITLLQLDDRRLLFTGDAGISALEAAADVYSEKIGSFSEFPLRFIQIPHHGSKRNVGPTILDRILGSKGISFSGMTTAYASSALADEKHPSPKVTNAFGRRGCLVSASEGRGIRHGHNAPDRDGWSTLTPLPPLREDDDD
jgi:beta-lactamase superfamily II metal-dependent hydrolase